MLKRKIAWIKDKAYTEGYANGQSETKALFERKIKEKSWCDGWIKGWNAHADLNIKDDE